MTLQSIRRAAAAWWRAKSSADQLIFAGLGVLVLTALLWLLVWMPISRHQSNVLRRISTIDTARADLARLPPDTALLPAPQARRALRDIVTASTAHHTIAIRRIEEDGAQLRLSLEPVGFEQLVNWLAGISAEHAITVSEISLARMPEPGQVSADLTLVTP